MSDYIIKLFHSYIKETQSQAKTYLTSILSNKKYVLVYFICDDMMFNKLIDFLFPKTCVATKLEWEYLSKDGRKELLPHPEMCPASHRFSRDFRTLPGYQKDFALVGIHICFYYGAHLKKLILKLKYYHQKDVVDTLIDRVILSIQTNHSLRTASKSSCCLTYVPSTRWRKYISKWYNQSELLAKSLGNKLGIPCVQLVKKIKYTPSQTKLTREERLVNMAGSFVVINDKSFFWYKNIIIIDDIVTTGSTINEIALTIKTQHPQSHIWGLVVGRHNK